MTRSERTQLISHELSPSERGRRAAEAAWRIEWPRLVAGLTRMFGDIDAAEDLAQDALLAALEQWPRDGVPPNPGAWLMLTAKHRAIDRRRRDATFRRKLSVLGGELVIEDAEQPLPASVDPDCAIEDDLLRMVFTACHPVLSPPARVALTLRLVGGLTTGRSRGPTWCRSRRWRSGSCGPSAGSQRNGSPTRCPTARSWRAGWTPCSM